MINEAVNNHFISVEDFDGDFWAWIELVNTSNQPVDLSSFFVTNTQSLPLRYQLPSVILQPGLRRLVLFSGKDLQQGTYIHSNFLWDRRQDEIFLYDANAQLVDFVKVPPLPFDHSWGRQVDGDSTWKAFRIPTPATPNHWGVEFQPLDAFVSTWPPSGVYDTDSLRIELNASVQDFQVRYTLDGSLPTSASPSYTGPFWMSPTPTDTFRYAGIPTNPASALPAWRWLPPLRMPETGNVLNVAVFDDTVRRSPYYTTHYFIGKRDWSVGVVSLSIDPEALFDHERGIYVPGKTHEDNPVSSSVWGTGNYHNRGRRWERLGHVALFESDGLVGFEQHVGVRIHGGGSRSLPQKSLRLYGRFIYGKGHMPYRFFPEDDYARYDRILLRNGGQGFLENIFNDVLVNAVMKPLNLTQQRSRPVQHFINGEYWGVANVRDYIDERFIAYLYNIPQADVRIIEPIFSHPDGKDSSMAAWLNFLEETTNMNAPGVYEAMQQYIDIDDFRDYYLARIFSAIYDWPMNNRRLWRANNEVLRNVLFDSDDAFQNAEANTLEHALEPDGPNWPNAPFSTLMFRKLIENQRFKNEFISRYESLARTDWHPNRLVAIVDSLQLIYRPIMSNHTLRWQYPGQTITAWLDYVQRNRDFLQKRHCSMRDHFIEQFDLSDDFLFEFDCTFKHLTNRDTILADVYPNPTNGPITIFLQAPTENELKLEIYNPEGKIVYRRLLIQEQARMKHTIDDLIHLNSGMYFLSITGVEKSWQSKLIKL